MIRSILPSVTEAQAVYIKVGRVCPSSLGFPKEGNTYVSLFEFLACGQGLLGRPLSLVVQVQDYKFLPVLSPHGDGLALWASSQACRVSMCSVQHQ